MKQKYCRHLIREERPSLDSRSNEIVCRNCGTPLGLIAKADADPIVEDDDESFADRAIEAKIDRTCGIYNPDSEWLF